MPLLGLGKNELFVNCKQLLLSTTTWQAYASRKNDLLSIWSICWFFPLKYKVNITTEDGRAERNRSVSLFSFFLTIYQVINNFSIVIEVFGEHFHRRILRDIDELCVGCIIGDNDDPLAAWPDCLGGSTEHICTFNTADALGSRHWHLLFGNCRDEGDLLLKEIVEKVCYLFAKLWSIICLLFRQQAVTRWQSGTLWNLVRKHWRTWCKNCFLKFTSGWMASTLIQYVFNVLLFALLLWFIVVEYNY